MRLLCPRDIRAALESLSDSIDVAYEQVMARIEEQTENRKMLARRVLSWVTYSRQQLSLKELQHALAVAPEMKEIDEDDIYDQDLLTSVCVGLVVLDEKSSIIRFVREKCARDNITMLMLHRLHGLDPGLRSGNLPELDQTGPWHH